MTRQKKARANVVGLRQTTQYTCVSASTCMALNAVGVKCTEDQVNEVIGAKPMQGARWEEVLACAQYFGCRATLTTPATLTQVKAWTDQGKPVLIAWNPEGREWSHASLIFDVTGEKGNYVVHVADPNIPNPDKTVREVGEDEFYSKWFEKWPNYLVRRPALMIEREVDTQGRQLMASERVDLKRFMGAVKEVVSSVRHLGFPFVFNKWSSKITKEVAYISYKLSAVGITNLSVDFLWDANGEVTAQVIEGTKVLHTVSGLRYFPSILNLLPNTTSKLASSTPFSCLLTATNASVGQVERALASIPAGLRTNREVAIAIADQLEGVEVGVGSLSLVDVVLRDLNNLMASRVASVRGDRMKYAGIMKPPPMLTQDVYEYILSQVATNYVKALNRKVRELRKFREVEEVRYEPLLTLIDELREVADTKGTRDIYSKYKEFYDVSRGFFGYGYTSDLKMKAFSSVKSSERREAVKALIESQIESNLEAMEGRLAYGERMIPNFKEKIKGFKELITVNLTPMKEGEVRNVQFPIYLDEWYVGQQSLEEHRERVKQTKLEDLDQMRSNMTSMLETAPDGARDFLTEQLERIIERADNLEDEIESLAHINVKIQVSNENPHWQAGTNTFFMPIKDAEKAVDGSGLMPDAQSISNHIHRIVVHEMTHAGQTILSYISLELKDFFAEYARLREKGNLAGLPSKKIRTPQFKQNQGDGRDRRLDLESHHLDDVEFYTDLRDAVRQIMSKFDYYGEHRKLTVQDKNLLFKTLVGQDIGRQERRKLDFLSYVSPIGFFLSLKRKAKDKYSKAVGEAYKLVFGSFAHQRMAQRIARVHLEKNKWELAPPKQLDQDQQEQVWEVYDFTYAKVGKHLSSKSALMGNYDIFWIVDVDGDDSIDAFIAYSTTASGKKIGLMGSNGVKSSMMAMLAKVGELLLSNGWYAEVDKKFMRIAKRASIPHITDEAKVREVLSKPLVWNDETGSYERNLEGLGEVTKYLIGNPL